MIRALMLLALAAACVGCAEVPVVVEYKGRATGPHVRVRGDSGEVVGYVDVGRGDWHRISIGDTVWVETWDKYPTRVTRIKP